MRFMVSMSMDYMNMFKIIDNQTGFVVFNNMEWGAATTLAAAMNKVLENA